MGPGVAANPSPFPKDGINRLVVDGDDSALNPAGVGTKLAFRYQIASVAPGASVTVQLALAVSWTGAPQCTAGGVTSTMMGAAQLT